MRIQPIVLAAGKGTRMGNPDLPKVLTPLAGRPMVEYVLATLAEGNYLPACLVVGFHQEKVRQALGDGYFYAVQEELLGTGHAVACAADQLAGTADYYLVMYGDQPCSSVETLQRLVGACEAGAVMSVAVTTSDQPTFTAFGRILRDTTGSVTGIREYKDCTDEEKAITEVNAGVYCFTDAFLWSSLKNLRNDNAQSEYYLTDLIGMAAEKDLRVEAVAMADWHEALGVNSPEQLEQLERFLTEKGA